MSNLPVQESQPNLVPRPLVGEAKGKAEGKGEGEAEGKNEISPGQDYCILYM